MKKPWRKLNNDSGATIILALVVMLVCALVAAVVITAASANAGRFSHLREEYQSYLTLRSSSELLRDELTQAAFTATETTVTHDNCTIPASTSRADYQAQGGDLSGLALELAGKISEGNPEATAEITISAPEMAPVTAVVTMDGSYNISAKLTTTGEDGGEGGSMSLSLAGSQRYTPRDSQTQTHSYEVYSGTYETCTIRTEIGELSVTWPTGVVERG